VATTRQSALLLLLAHRVGRGTGAWLAWGMGFFVVGWLIQFIGHYYEGRKPAFADDIVGLLVGPMFVTADGDARSAGPVQAAVARDRAPRRARR
jgi:uncharacterized membrane protein YGL010W